MRRNLVFVPLLLATAVVLAEDVPEAKRVPSASETQAKTEEGQAKTDGDAKEISGMSILGNQEAPKSLVIVPWKSSELGQSLGISPMLDDSRQPVDKEVFMRALGYYEIRSEATRHDGASSTGR
jgi:hypothetical protein